MAVIAMTREMGTLGKDVAFGLSEQMGLTVVHHELVERDVANQMEMQESEVHRYLEGTASLFERWKMDDKRLSRYTAAELVDIARQGHVLIRGWGAGHLLKDVSHVVRVRICAPMSFRVRVMMERMGLSDAAVARREIERNDAAHTKVLHNLFVDNWEHPLNYHMVLNTGCTPVEACIDQVRVLAGNPAFRETAESRSKLADKVIENRVRNLLDTGIAPGFYGRRLDANVESGTVILSGVVSHKSQINGIIEKVSGLAEVKAVEDKLVSIERVYAG